MEISAEMHFLLQKFQEKQTKEFYEIMWKIMNRLDIFEQVSIITLMKKIITSFKLRKISDLSHSSFQSVLFFDRSPNHRIYLLE